MMKMGEGGEEKMVVVPKWKKEEGGGDVTIRRTR